MMGKVRHMLLILVVRVVSLMGHWVIVVAVETSMMVRAVIEVLRVVVSIMMTMFHLVVRVVMIRIVMLSNMLGLVMVRIHGQVVVNVVMLRVVVLIQVLSVMVIVVILVVRVLMDWLVMINNVMHNLVDDWLVVNNLVNDLVMSFFVVGSLVMDVLVMRFFVVRSFMMDVLVVGIFIVSLSDLRVGLGLMRVVMSLLIGVKMLSLVLIDKVMRGVMYVVIRGLVVYNFAMHDIVMTNLLVMAQHVVVDHSRFVVLMLLFLVDMACHVFLVELLGNLNVPGMLILSLIMDGLVMNWLVMNWLVMNWLVMNWLMINWLVNGLVMESLVVHRLNLNVSDLGLVMSVLRNLDVAFMSGLLRVNRLVARLFYVVRLIHGDEALMSAILVGPVFRLHIVVSIVL